MIEIYLLQFAGKKKKKIDSLEGDSEANVTKLGINYNDVIVEAGAPNAKPAPSAGHHHDCRY